jgi:fatty acid desaturase
VLQKKRRQVAFAVVLLSAALLFLVFPTIAMLLVGLFLVWWLLVTVRDVRDAGEDGETPRSG